MKKFVPENWRKVDAQETFKTSSGKLHMRATQDCSVFIKTGIFEALAGTAKDLEVEVKGDFSYRFETEGDVYVWAPPEHIHVSTGERYTNADRLPLESGQLAEVTRALREIEFARQGLRKDMQALAKLRQQRDEPKPAPAPEPVAEPEPAADPAAE